MCHFTPCQKGKRYKETKCSLQSITFQILVLVFPSLYEIQNTTKQSKMWLPVLNTTELLETSCFSYLMINYSLCTDSFSWNVVGPADSVWRGASGALFRFNSPAPAFLPSRSLTHHKIQHTSVISFLHLASKQKEGSSRIRGNRER